MIELFHIANFAFAAFVAASALAGAGVKRVCPAMLDRLRHVRIVSAAGASSGVIAVSPCLLDGGATSIADLTVIPLCGLLAAAAYVDRTTTWAPDELTFPICLLSGIVGFGGPDEIQHDALSALGLGFLLFAVARGTWIFQIWLSRTILPPPDVLGVALPFVLLESRIMLALNMFALASALIAIRCFPQIAGLVGNRACLALAVGRTGRIDRANGVAFLGLAHPLAVVFLSWETLFGWNGTLAF